MAQETMGKWERVWGALTGEYMPDRVPVSPMLLSGAVAGLQGLTQGQIYNNYELALDSFIKTHIDYGTWDLSIGEIDIPEIYYFAELPFVWKIPGRDIPDDYMLQIREQETIRASDYDKILEMGYSEWYKENLFYRLSGWKEAEVQPIFEKILDLTDRMKERLLLECDGTRRAYGASCVHPFFLLSVGRSLMPFSQDLYFMPEKVEAVISQITNELIPKMIAQVNASGIPTALIIEERASAYNYPLHIFERFFMKYTVKMVEAFSAEGICTIFHLDQPWDKNIPSFKNNLKKNSFALQLDGTTDIVAAKEYMGDYCSFEGDIPASLMSLGTPEEVEAYVKKLIKKVAYDGRFILTNGCNCPPDVKPENLRAMLDTARTAFY